MSIWQASGLIDLAVVADWESVWGQGQVRILPVSPLGQVAMAHTGSEGRLGFVPPTGPFDPDRHIYLGQVGGTPVFAALEKDPAQITLREALGYLDETGVEIAMRASALAQFHATNQFCPQCGQRTGMYDLGRSRWCAACQVCHFPRLDPAIIVAITDEQDRLLLGRHSGWGENRFSVLAGFTEAGESLEQTVCREMFEEVRLRVTDIRYVGSQPWPMPRSLMVGFTAVAAGQTPVADMVEIIDARWFSRTDLATALAQSTLTLPPPASIARQLVTRWYGSTLEA